MQGVVPGKELPGAKPDTRHSSAAASVMAPCKTNTECYYYFSPFLEKMKIVFGFLSISKNRH